MRTARDGEEEKQKSDFSGGKQESAMGSAKIEY